MSARKEPRVRAPRVPGAVAPELPVNVTAGAGPGAR